jgi:hypothetical protein
MRYIHAAFNLLLPYIFSLRSDPKSFFDFSAKEKKAIIKKAAIESNRMQQELIDQYNKLYATSITNNSTPSVN